MTSKTTSLASAITLLNVQNATLRSMLQDKLIDLGVLVQECFDLAEDKRFSADDRAKAIEWALAILAGAVEVVGEYEVQ